MLFHKLAQFRSDSPFSANYFLLAFAATPRCTLYSPVSDRSFCSHSHRCHSCLSSSFRGWGGSDASRWTHGAGNDSVHPSEISDDWKSHFYNPHNSPYRCSMTRISLANRGESASKMHPLRHHEILSRAQNSHRCYFSRRNPTNQTHRGSGCACCGAGTDSHGPRAGEKGTAACASTWLICSSCPPT